MPQDEWSILWWYGTQTRRSSTAGESSWTAAACKRPPASATIPCPPDKTWQHSWRDSALAPGQYYHRHEGERLLGPYRLITHWMSSEDHVEHPEPPEPPDWWDGSAESWEQIRTKEAHVYAKWTVRLDCGHLGSTLTDPGWQPGSEPQTNADRAETLCGKIEASDLFSNEPEERAHWLRMIELGPPSPRPEVGCSDCEGVHAIVGYERAGWLVPPPVMSKPRQPKPRTPTQEELLQKRIKELEAENTRLKASNQVDERRVMACCIMPSGAPNAVVSAFC